MANAVYSKAGTAVQWTDTTGDLAMTLNGLGTGAGYAGAEKDWGVLTTARPTLYHYVLKVQFAVGPTLATQVRLYWNAGDGTTFLNDDGETNVPVSVEDKLSNLIALRSLNVDESASGVVMATQGYFRDFNRYGFPVVWNATNQTLVATNDLNWVTVTPIYEEIAT